MNNLARKLQNQKAYLAGHVYADTKNRGNFITHIGMEESKRAVEQPFLISFISRHEI